MPASKTKLRVVCADITTLSVDAIVNAANAALAGGGGVDGAIHSAAGPQLLAACQEIGGCATGGAVVTPGFKLAAKYVIHAVGPIWSGGRAQEAELLSSCYRNCMKIARDLQLGSIAFSAISCGVYGFPVNQAAQIAVSTIREELATSSMLGQIDFVCFGDVVADAYRQALLPN
ncbi:MAG: O-acetyl-ADP-ribose deacetylase [Planctomycetes bacterium]|nr:O-acetyl-ADP-ribose deacetylase [Planctomycetota bacterium]